MTQVDPNAERYLELLKSALSNSLYPEHEVWPVKHNNALRRFLVRTADRFGMRLTTNRNLKPEDREFGRVMAPMAHTSIGRKRLDHLHGCIRTIVADGIPGDLIETGVWRGGAVIFMRGALNAYGESRTVWAADSFEGLPAPDAQHPQDEGARWHLRPELAVSLERVQEHARRYGLLEGIEFLKGWFKDTLPSAPLDRLALARLDGDMYGSTMDALTALYDKVSPGGFVIIDDYSGVPACKAAVEDFRRERGITEPIEEVDWTCAFWRKS